MVKVLIDRSVVEQALEALDALTDRVDGTGFANTDEFDRALDAIDALRAALEQPQVELERIEQYRLQMAAIMTAALGYWKEGDSIHPDYDTVALRDVAKLYAKYDELFNIAHGIGGEK